MRRPPMTCSLLSRRAGTLACLLSVAALALAPVAASAQQLNPLTPLPTTPSPTVTAPVPVTSTSSSTSTGAATGSVVILVVGLAVALLALIAWLIVRDARRVAPVAARGREPAGTAAPRRAQRERARARAARRQRKRNR